MSEYFVSGMIFAFFLDIVFSISNFLLEKAFYYRSLRKTNKDVNNSEHNS